MRKGKHFYKSAEEIKPLLTDWHEDKGCFASDHITVEGRRVGLCYREEPDPESDFADSGWRFLSGEETNEYANDPNNVGIYDLNTICNYDPEIIPLLHSPYGSAFERNEKGVFISIEDFFEEE
ncbi:MAG: DUF2185 domain-containing protein [Capnocytophaga sp.]|nr:DUF2185 domain-containing protein [Capnocytophaga sp.]